MKKAQLTKKQREQLKEMFVPKETVDFFRKRESGIENIILKKIHSELKRYPKYCKGWMKIVRDNLIEIREVVEEAFDITNLEVEQEAMQKNHSQEIDKEMRSKFQEKSGVHDSRVSSNYYGAKTSDSPSKSKKAMQEGEGK